MPVVPEPPSDVGATIPAHTPHGVSVMFPKWEHNVLYEEGHPSVISKMETGYPRFFVNLLIQELCKRLLAKHGKPTEAAFLYPSRKIADRCREFMKQYYAPAQQENLIRIAEVVVAPIDEKMGMRAVPVFMVLFPQDAFPVAKQFWQHTGDIFSSRCAEYCLHILDKNEKHKASHAQEKPRRASRYAKPTGPTSSAQEDESDHAAYVEERYGRNMPLQFADQAKVVLRRRIAGLLSETQTTIEDVNKATQAELEAQRKVQGERGMLGLSEDDVYLFASGMGAIYHAHRVARAILPDERKSVCFGFPYTDTLKILQKWGSGCYFYGLGEDKDLDDFEAKLAGGERVLSLFCELPSNPLLKSPDLARIRRLADQYDFLVVVDETIGNFVNVDTLTNADIVVSSLTKIFSGDCNVMGGSMVLNPARKHYRAIREFLQADFEDLVWCEDALFVERNSRNFKERAITINENAEALCDYLNAHSKVERVFYPKFICRQHYDAVKKPNGGYGGLLSVVLKNEKAAQQFYDNLHCAKGPSLGTNFTLASPYTILAHYTELDWAEQYGVSRHLVRVSVGLENRDHLLSLFKSALDAVDEN